MISKQTGQGKTAEVCGFAKLRDVPDGNDRVVIVDESSLEGGRDAARKILAAGRPVNGVVCGEDITAIGLMKEFKERGYRVPEDIAITGCNNSPDSRICEPELTTLDNKPELLGGMCFLLQETGWRKVSLVAIRPAGGARSALFPERLGKTAPYPCLGLSTPQAVTAGVAIIAEQGLAYEIRKSAFQGGLVKAKIICLTPFWPFPKQKTASINRKNGIIMQKIWK